MDNEQEENFDTIFMEPHYINISWEIVTESQTYEKYWSMTDEEFEIYKIFEYRKILVNEYGFR